MSDNPSTSSSLQSDTPVPPARGKPIWCAIFKETKDLWYKLFLNGKAYGADVYLSAEDDKQVPAHFFVLRQASPAWELRLLDSMPDKNGVRHIKIDPSVPVGALWIFIRYLYSSYYDEEDMKKYVLDLLALSISYDIASLQQVCLSSLELHTENVIEKLQLARTSNEPKLSTICMALIVRNFNDIKLTEGWKTMCQDDPVLQKELLELAEYWELHEVMEALVHYSEICCNKTGQAACGFPKCRRIMELSQHLTSCQTTGAGSCGNCDQMNMYLRLHSRLCHSGGSCKVLLCGNFKSQASINQMMPNSNPGENVLDNWVRGLKKAKSLFSEPL